MMTLDRLAQAIKEMGLDPIIDESRSSLSLVYEMKTVVCIYDEGRKTLTMTIINRSGISEEKKEQETQRCHVLNEITNIAKCFVDADGDLIMAYQSKLWHEEDISDILKDGLGCLAAMMAMYIQMKIKYDR